MIRKYHADYRLMKKRKIRIGMPLPFPVNFERL